MLILLFLLLLAGIYCLWREWETLGSGVCTAAGILLLIVGCGPLALWLLDRQTDYSSAIPRDWASKTRSWCWDMRSNCSRAAVGSSPGHLLTGAWSRQQSCITPAKNPALIARSWSVAATRSIRA